MNPRSFIYIFYGLVVVEGMTRMWLEGVLADAWPRLATPLLFSVVMVWVLAVFILRGELAPSCAKTANSPAKASPAIFKADRLAVGIGAASTLALWSAVASMQHYVLFLLVAPVVEEVLYRGYMLSNMLRLHVRENAIVLNALLFTAAHVNIADPMHWRAYCTIMAGGLFFGVCFVRLGLWGAVSAHFLGNALFLYINSK